MEDETLRQAWTALFPLLDERSRRLIAAMISEALGYGGLAQVARATGLAPTTIGRGRKDLANPARAVPRAPRVRRPGGGRPAAQERDPELVSALESLVDPVARGDPQSPLRWTCKSTRQLAAELKRLGHLVSHETVANLLHGAGYSLQGNRKTKEGASHPDRNAQFEHINDLAQNFQSAQQPAVSMDTKKKELVGDFKNGGREWRPEGDPEPVRVHDFPDKTLGKAIPYGIYDLHANEGWVSVGTDHDTAEFAVATLGHWWRQMGQERYARATDLMITADCGGSNGNRCHLWKVGLQRFADEANLRLWVCHLPPGTSKWNKIEHRMFSYITQNWRARPLVSHEAVVNLIAATTTRKGLRIRAHLDPATYPVGRKPSPKELNDILMRVNPFHGEWNYILIPHQQRDLAFIS